ncbi:MAG: hypothetical protein IPO30_11610 [Hyphomonadaceae bacterium]|jgi:hypothetical protein|nr:hypothetical protein [Hyphomonadaceae bacterium]MBP9234316.1 hypothetical protein [Hyphomonadaceae bacterium]
METTSVIEPTAQDSNVQWGPIFAGVSIATATGLVLLTFGATLGLSVTSPYEGEGLSPVAFVIMAGLYLLWVQVMSFFMGGYVAARLRGRAPGASEHEVDVRDGMHGLVVWGVGVVAAGFISFVGIGGIGVTSQADTQTSSAIATVVDEQVDEAAAQERLAAGPQDASAAERRAEAARKLTVISGFITAASLLVGAVAAFFGAQSGGNHRDKDVRSDFFVSKARVIRKVEGQ